MIARKELYFASSRFNVEKIVNEVIEDIKDLPWDKGDLDFIKLAMIEALVNAVVHGNKECLNKKVRLAYEVKEEALHLEISDEGKGFSPKEVGELDLLSESGRGILLINASMDEVSYNEKGTTIYMTKYIPQKVTLPSYDKKALYEQNPLSTSERRKS
ncbi:ATP-binding protein [Heliorestis convoluta]|uniref:Anti-sigma regulatory factor (Ser/Thr protein kinase), putative n=1 Tax=Heliorestis convoluta TaxID=356322 RepID=A0A5Q2N9D8_9FIRM|nr:ATP-binding protein [Heliorestis convoluta]QGG49115.1 Anti-sigma regulatory factor (Ser/Thr protein kinase), putative [Heliorestis convoluta]